MPGVDPSRVRLFRCKTLLRVVVRSDEKWWFAGLVVHLKSYDDLADRRCFTVAAHGFNARMRFP